MIKFTKGPWTKSEWNIIGADNSVVCKVLAWDSSGCRKEDIDNANLISAAPELYEAVTMLLPMWESGIDKPWVKQAIQALKKARGEV